MQKYLNVRICTNTYTRIRTNTLTHTCNTHKCLHTFTLSNSTYICTQIYIITHRRRLTNTGAHAHSETHARTLTHTYNNMHMHPHRFEAYNQLCTYPHFHTKNERKNLLFKAYACTITYAHTHTHTHIHMHTHIHTPSYKHIASCQLKYLLTYTCLHMHKYEHMCTHIVLTFTYTYVYKHAHLHT